MQMMIREARSRCRLGASSSILLVIAGLTAGCGEEAERKMTVPALEYEIALNSDVGSELTISLKTKGTNEGKTVVAIDETWGGAGAVADQVRDLRARGSSGHFLAVDRPEPHRWVVTHAPDDQIEISYVLSGASSDERSRHRYLPVVGDELILLVGHTALVRPEALPPDGEVDLTIRWRGLSDPDWQIVSSFGPSNGLQQERRPLEDLIHAFYSGGKLRSYQRRIAGANLHIAIAGTAWRFDDQAFCEMVATVMEFEREFYEDPEHPPYTVILVPYPGLSPDSSSKGGTNLTDSYVLYLTSEGYAGEHTTGIEPLETLITHEYFHNWNRPGPDDDAMHWFSEGFTVFYERRVLCRLGLFTPEECLDHLNRTIRNYATSPKNETPNDVYVRSRMLDRELQSLPYDRGAFIAVMVDDEIRRLSGGTRSLDDFMRKKRSAELVAGEGLRNDEVFEMLATETSPEFSASIRAIAIDGASAVLVPHTYAGCLAMDTAHLSPFDLGFDFEASRRDGIVTGVRESSNAFGAGLRDGQKITGWSVYHGNPDKQVKLGVVDNGEKKTIIYLPRGSPVAVQQFRLKRGVAEECNEVF
jgi:predicted metalloprotease with PDZ domain